MACYYPQKVYYPFRPIAHPTTGQVNRAVLFNPPSRSMSFYYDIITIPCGKCVGCRLQRSRVWAGRIMHESQFWADAFFLTLTYDDYYLPERGSLVKSDVQDFIKRLRDRLDYPPISYFLCGEYGDQSMRPHYHMILFGVDFPDRKLWSIKNEQRLYTSAFLESVWGLGHCPIGSVTFESAGYVARYIMKKQTGKNAYEHYERFDPHTGEIYDLLPEYVNMSLKPTIGRRFYDKYKFDMYEKDEVLINKHPSRPPRYYDLLFKKEHPDLWEDVCINRGLNIDKLLKDEDYVFNHSPERLIVQEQVKIKQIQSLVRSL